LSTSRAQALNDKRLIEEQEFLLRSLDDLEDEYANGDLTDKEYETLRDDYMRRLATVARARKGETATVNRSQSRFWWLLAIGVTAVIAGVAVAQFSGLRAPGDPISGNIESSPRSRLADAQNLFFADDLERAREVVEEVLRDAPDMQEALVLSARLHERSADPLSAVRQLDQVLRVEPQHIEALTLRGWILVRVDDPEVRDEGIRNLDEAVALKPENFDAYIFRGFVARELQRDLPLAIEMYQEALNRSPPQAMQAQLERIIDEMRVEIASKPE
tara:strand:+ start:10639 stop:11460 length:822 start_codon:yes stop_codon:yes gene_type:complete